MAEYGDGGSNSLAILLKETDTSWLGLAHGLKSIGVPFRIVTNAEEALQHDVVMVYPLLTGANSQPEELRQFADHVRSGKTLLAFSVIGGGMPDIFGFGNTIEQQDLSALTFNQDALINPYITTPGDAIIYLNSLTEAGTGLPGVVYTDTKHPPIATYSNGAAAITHNFFAAGERVGHAYAIGFDMGHYIQRAHNGRFVSYATTYVNDYQPKIDILLGFIKSVYEQGEEDAVVLYTVPFNKSFTALVTHDIDFVESLDNTLAYADYETSQGIPATYFIQTKYVTDDNEGKFFDPSKVPVLQGLSGLGMEIGSHSVAHSNEFKTMPLGTGREMYPEYEPFVFNFTTVRDASIAGELRVSKFLLESTSGQQMDSFRPGHLSLPEQLPQMLEATGYRFSSSITANQALTHFPYQAMFDRNYDSELDIYEFPVTIEDEQGRLGSRQGEAITVAEKIGRNGGLVNLLIHTDVLDHKLEFERGFVERFKDEAWFSTMRDFGTWWAARDSVSYTLTNSTAQTRTLSLQVVGSIDGLTLQIPDNWQYQQGPEGSVQQDNRLVLGFFTGSTQVRFNIR